jgi:hypothetical protein
MNPTELIDRAFMARWREYKAATTDDERAQRYQAWRAAVTRYVARLPDDGSGDDIGDPDDEGDAYPRKAVRYAAA